VRSTSIEVKDKGIEEVGGVADKEAHTVHAINIIPQRQDFVDRCPVMFLDYIPGTCVCFRSTCKLVT
jgi:hypothetical protein